MDNNYAILALVNILVKKGIITEDEFIEEFEKIKTTEENRNFDALYNLINNNID